MATNSFSLSFLFLASNVHHLHSSTVDFIHRSSPQFRRSISSAAHFRTDRSHHDIQSRIIPANGEYLMKLSIGTPPFPVLGIADTGSDFTWVQCQPCTNCYPQDSPLFDPRNSSTYRKLSCQSRRCQGLHSTCDRTSNICRYNLTYGDNSYTFGNVAAKTLTFGSTSGETVSIPKVVFGCGYNNRGSFGEEDNGIIGLGASKYSIVNQLRRFTNGKFTYCLVPYNLDQNVTSKISFGESANVFGAGVVSNPLLIDLYYYITLESISVENISLAFKTNFSKGQNPTASGLPQEYNMIINWGTTLTLLPSGFYEDLEEEVRKAIKGNPISDPLESFNLCYSTNDNIVVPKIRMKFTGAELELTNTFVQITNDLACFTIVPTDIAFGILGNLSQRNYLIGYDTKNSTLSFEPTDCTKH